MVAVTAGYGAGERRVRSEMGSAEVGREHSPLHAASIRNLTHAPSFAVAYIDQEGDRVQKGRPAHLREPRDARRRLALAGDYWLHFGDHHGGMIG